MTVTSQSEVVVPWPVIREPKGSKIDDGKMSFKWENRSLQSAMWLVLVA